MPGSVVREPRFRSCTNEPARLPLLRHLTVSVKVRAPLTRMSSNSTEEKIKVGGNSARIVFHKLISRERAPGIPGKKRIKPNSTAAICGAILD